MGNTKARRRAVVHPWGQYQDKVSFLLMQVACRPGIMVASSLDEEAAFPYFRTWRCFAAGAVPGLQNQWMAERSSVGSTPMHLRQLEYAEVPRRPEEPGGDFLYKNTFSVGRSCSSSRPIEKVFLFNVCCLLIAPDQCRTMVTGKSYFLMTASTRVRSVSVRDTSPFMGYSIPSWAYLLTPSLW